MDLDEMTDIEVLEHNYEAVAVEQNHEDPNWWDVWTPMGPDDSGEYWATMHGDDIQELADRGEVEVYYRTSGTAWEE